jgi:6-phosphofructokinase 2
MKPIVTLTVNPATDASCTADEVVPVHKVRTRGERYDPGGGGLNVARVVAELGGEAAAFYLAGDSDRPGAGRLGLAQRHRGRARADPGPDPVSHTVHETSTGHEFRFTPEGQEVAEAERRHCLEVLSVGAGDSFVGAMVWALARGLPAERAFAYGIAAGAATVLTPGTELCRREDVGRLVTAVAEGSPRAAAAGA